MTWRAILPLTYLDNGCRLGLALAVALGVAAQVEVESKVKGGSSYCSFKCLFPGGFNVGLIGSTCTALPWSSRPGTASAPGVRVRPLRPAL